MLLIPNIIEKNYNGEKIYDIYTKLLTKRIVFITGEINDDLANLVISELLYLDSISHDDIYLYTGLTSIVNDESNLGFILTNMRTNETSFYSAPGAEEYSAMASAEGAVQQMGYKSTFPLLINLNNKPTYLVSLKDAAGLVKMYGFVDVSDYQKVVVTDSSKGIEQAAKNYLGKDFTEEDDTKLTEKEITIKSIKTATIDGNTYYYLIDKENNKYKVSIKVSDKLPYLKADQSIKIGYSQETEITIIKKIF